MTSTTRYTPWVERCPGLAPIEMLRLRQLPQIIHLEGLEVGVLPVDVECLRACSRVSGFCAELGQRGGRCSLEAYTPLIPGVPPAWAPRITFEVEGSEPLVEEPVVKRVEPKLVGVYAPRLLYLEPLAARWVRVEACEARLWAGCVEGPRGGFAFYSVGGEAELVAEPGRVVVEGDVVAFSVRRCSRGVLSQISRLMASRVRAPARLLGSLVVLAARGDGEALELILWNPHTAPRGFELYASGRILEARLCDARGCERLEALRGSMLKGVVGGETAARLELRLKRASPLLRGKR